MDVADPATQQAFTSVPRASKAQVDKATASASAAETAQTEMSFAQRQASVPKMTDAIAAGSEELARSLTTEQGKPLTKATGKITLNRRCLGVAPYSNGQIGIYRTMRLAR